MAEREVPLSHTLSVVINCGDTVVIKNDSYVEIFVEPFLQRDNLLSKVRRVLVLIFDLLCVSVNSK